MQRIDDEIGFRNFASGLERVLDKYEKLSSQDLLVVQRRQLKELIGLENEFKQNLLNHPDGPRIYRDFVDFILITKRNILAARPYFRERQGTFIEHLSEAFKERRYKDIYPFRINWSFISFVLECQNWSPKTKVAQTAKKVNILRKEMLEQNIPLAISQARVFWDSTPRSHLTYMDLIQIHCQGLLLAIDKFTPLDDTNMTNEESLEAYKTFRAVALGIMMRDRVSKYSETFLHFYPNDKCKIYRANKILRRVCKGDVDYQKLAEGVNALIRVKQDEDGNDTINEGEKTTASEISMLLSSASTVSADFVLDEDGDPITESYPIDPDNRGDTLFEEYDCMRSLRVSIKELNLLEQKIVKLLGVKF